MVAASTPGWRGSWQPGHGGGLSACRWRTAAGCSSLKVQVGEISLIRSWKFSVWLMELALGVSVVLFEGSFGGAGLWFVAGVRVVDVWAGRRRGCGLVRSG
jgi:hypothetical protein